MTIRIPYNRPLLAGAEMDHILDAINRRQLAGDGHYTFECQKKILGMTDGHACLLTHSCTAALEMAALLCDLKPGDEVILPSFTFVSTANAMVLRGAIPVFVDIRPDTLNLDETLVGKLVTDRTRAIIAVHYAGVAAEMDALAEVALANNLILIEDAAQAFNSTYKGRKVGSLGALSAFSFHETKNIVSGEGGALVINDPALVARAEILREKGTNRKQFTQGFTDKYTWVDVGSSYLPGELVAAFLFGQLECAGEIHRHRMDVWNHYAEALVPLKDLGYGLPRVPEHCGHNAHLFYVLTPSAGVRDQLITLMRRDGIATPFHYVPLHSSPAGRKFGRAPLPMTVTDDLSAKLLRLPMYPRLGEERREIVDRLLHHAAGLAGRRASA